MPQRFIDDIRENAADCNKDNDRPAMKEFVDDESDNMANHDRVHEQHMPVYYQYRKYMDMACALKICATVFTFFKISEI
jgi:hypothetical protein